MVASRSRKIVKLLYLPVLAGSLFAFSNGAFSSPIAAVASKAQSVLEKEQALSPTQLIDRWTPFIKEASRRFGVAEAWIKAVIRMESGGRTQLDDKKPITSSAGAMGIMQVMPETYQDMRQQYGLGADPYDPHNNVLAGTAYLSWLYGKYGYPKMFAAYNAGPGTVEAQAAGARKLPDETRAYVSGITRILGTPSKPPQPIEPIATLTRPNGLSVAIDAAAVDSIRASFPDEYAPGVQTVLNMGNRRQGVTEDLATVASLLRRHGAKV
ncbi:MAG TPA: lytic transglycosylase domain-containing protein [Micropepsaceae bacterium]|nr:lytic transglycosylase domain-containing protein [Micropepsaceae bacterium]